MIPNEALVSGAPVTDYLEPDNRLRATLREDYERGALALQNPSGGLEQSNWRVASDGTDIWVQNLLSGPPIKLLDATLPVTEISLAFDASMNPQLAWAEGSGEIKFRWYDASVPGYVITTLTAARSPRLCLDDKRANMDTWRDVLLIYIKTGTPEQLVYRQQRDRYANEYLLMDLPENFLRLGRVGMARSTRLQIELIVRDTG